MIFTQWSIFLDVHWKLVDQFFLLGKDYSIWRNIDNGNTCLESYHLHHQWLGHISWNWIKRLIDSGILNFSGRTMVHVKHIWFFDTPCLLRWKEMKGPYLSSFWHAYGISLDIPTRGQIIYFISLFDDYSFIWSCLYFIVQVGMFHCAGHMLYWSAKSVD